MKAYIPFFSVIALVVAAYFFYPRESPKAVEVYQPQAVDFAKGAELEQDRKALRDTIRDTVWRVIKKAAGVRVDTLLETRVDTLTIISMVTDSALTCQKTRDSLFRVDSAYKAQIANFNCEDAPQSKITPFLAGTVLGFLLCGTAVIVGN